MKTKDILFVIVIIIVIVIFYKIVYWDSLDNIYYKNIIVFKENYTKDKIDFMQGREELINNNYKGDCEDYANYLYYLFNNSYQTQIVKGFRINQTGSRRGHAWIRVYINNVWYEYDSTSYLICSDFCLSKKYNINQSIIKYKQ